MLIEHNIVCFFENSDHSYPILQMLNKDLFKHLGGLLSCIGETVEKKDFTAILSRAILRLHYESRASSEQ